MMHGATGRRICFLFPGQGVQKIGMMSDFPERFERFNQFLSQASEWSGVDIKHIASEPNNLIDQTSYTQVVILAMELGLLRVLSDIGIEPSVMAGDSLGEYACLVCSKALDEESAIRLVAKRAEIMQRAVPSGIGAMAAVIGMEWSMVEGVLEDYDKVWISNYNTPDLVSISGEKYQVESASETLREMGARKVVKVNVSGPFHTPLLDKASAELKMVLDRFDFADPQIPYYANYDADIVKSKDRIRYLLANQVQSPVKWSQSIAKLVVEKPDVIVEVGPGKSLRGFLRNEKGLSLYGLESASQLQELCLALESNR